MIYIYTHIHVHIMYIFKKLYMIAIVTRTASPGAAHQEAVPRQLTPFADGFPEVIIYCVMELSRIYVCVYIYIYVIIGLVLERPHYYCCDCFASHFDHVLLL